jgi:hypothetical protein
VNLIKLETALNMIIGGVITIVVAYCFYRKADRDLQAAIGVLSQENSKLRELVNRLERGQSLQLERDCKLGEGEDATIIKNNNNYGLKTSASMNGSINIRTKDGN